MSRKRDPKEVKIAKGETRPSRHLENIVDFPVVDETPAPPSYLRLKASKDLWNEVAPILFAQRILTIADTHALGHLCQLHGEVLDCYKRKVPVSASALTQLRQYFSEFGMTPASRSKVAGAEPQKPGNKFNGNGRKRQ